MYLEYIEGIHRDLLVDTPYKVKLSIEGKKYLTNLLKQQEQEAYQKGYEAFDIDNDDKYISRDKLQEQREEAVTGFSVAWNKYLTELLECPDMYKIRVVNVKEYLNQKQEEDK